MTQKSAFLIYLTTDAWNHAKRTWIYESNFITSNLRHVSATRVVQEHKYSYNVGYKSLHSYKSYKFLGKIHSYVVPSGAVFRLYHYSTHLHFVYIAARNRTPYNNCLT